MRRLLLLFAATFAASFAWITPPGEAPDELAHLRYAETLARGQLPAMVARGAEGYEAHQPPLGYTLPALVLAAAGGVSVSPVANPELDFHAAGSRAFLTPFATARDRLVLRVARMTQALWLALTVWAGLAFAGDPRIAAPYLLAPQLLFLCGAINNDAALIACTTCALLLLVRFVETGAHAFGAGALTAVAFFTKGIALFLLVPVAVAAFLAPPSSTRRASSLRSRLVLLSTTAIGLLAWVTLNLLRFRSLLPPIPTSVHVATWHELLTEPRWLGTLFRSFWGKFGWLNTPMPWPFYLWFAALTAVALVGVARMRGPRRAVLLSAVLANFGLVLAYLLTVDLQPQGRYLLPSIAAVAAFASFAGTSPPRWLCRVSTPLAFLVALAALVTVHLAYH